MPDNDNGPLLQIQSILNSVAPHVLLLKIQEALNPPKPVVEKPAEVTPRSEYAEKPWTAPRHTEQVITDRYYDPRLTTYWKLNEGLIGQQAKSGQYVESRPDRLAYLGLGYTVDDWGGMKSEVIQPKAEVKPEGLPFASDRKSGPQYWQDTPKKPLVTQFF